MHDRHAGQHQHSECEKGIGDVILAPDSPKLIEGVKCAPLTLWPDDRGYFLEVQRFGEGLAEGFSKETTQISAALNYPGIIKAFHFHRHQTDCWTPAVNMFQIALVDIGPSRPPLARAIQSTQATCGPGKF